ncbi:MAG: leucine-rich repeat protein [Clostridiales bacterium]|nr:leucine-rich repeat protein [Clostridiales bacterium]
MKKKHFYSWVMIGIMCLSLFAPVTCKQVSAMTILETDVADASDGCTMFGVYGSYYSQAQDALARINEIRKEACDAGNVPDPREPSRMLTSSDYVPIKWSKDLESVARIRAMEGGLAYSFMGSGHNRLNGKGIFSVEYNGIQSYAEDLAYNWGTSMVYGINQWYGEKSDWVNQVSGKVTGHYTSMINPNYTYVGLGDFYTEEAVYPNTLAGEFCSGSQGLDQTMQTAQADVMQKIEVKDSYITGYVLEGQDTIYTEKTTTLTPKVNLANGSKTHQLWVIDTVTYTSSNPSVATVTNAGVVTGLKNGTTTISAKSGGTTLATIVITVKCNHAKELVSETQPTCTATGLKVYSCEICGESMEQVVSKIPHDYVYGDADSSGYRKGVCSGCGDTIQIVPPTTFELYWNTAAYGSFSWAFPSSTPVGSSVYCYIYGVDGDSSYRNMVIESTDESVISVPEKAIANSANNKLNVLAPGITTLTIYPKYNPSLKKKVTVRIGNSESVDISTADVTLSQTSYKYDGTACTPSVSVSYHDTSLTKGTDYTVAYENNTKAGIATVVITGKGIFTGTIRKNFTISNIEHSEHIFGDWKVVSKASCTTTGEKRRDCMICDYYETEAINKLEHTIVEDAAEAATCTKNGKTAGSHCSVCGEVIQSQEVIPAIGHSWDDTYTIDVQPTETTNGSKSIHCSHCSAIKDETVIPATGTKDDKEDTSEEKPDNGKEDGEEENPTNDKEDSSEEKPTNDKEDSSEEKPTNGKEDSSEEKPTNGKVDSSEEEKTTDDKEDDDENPTTGSTGDSSAKDSSGKKPDLDEDDTEDEDISEEGEYPRVGERFKVKGIIYKVVKSNPEEDEFAVACIGTTSKSIVKLDIPNYISDDDFDYEVVSIGKKAFSGCKKLKNVTIGDFVADIGEQAFYGCTSLKKITIPSKTKKIGVKAFAKCKMLSLVNIKSNLLTEKNVGKQAFANINKKAVVKVPSKKKAVYKKWLKKKGLTGKNQKIQ